MRCEPERGGLYMGDLDPTVGHEQSGRRPVLVLSINPMNRAPAGLVVGVPLTTTDWSNKLHVRIDPAQSGLPRISYAMPEMVRHLSTLRLGRRLGRVSTETVDTVAQHAGILIGLGRTR